MKMGAVRVMRPAPNEADTSLVENDQPFAAALRSALDASGLGLERIQRRLDARGTHLSVATLSYWQSGRRVPSRRESFEALTELEVVLGLTAGTLVRLIPRRGSGARAVDSIAALAANLQDGLEVPAMFAELDARLRRSVELLSEHTVVTVAADRAQHSRRIRRVLRAVADDVDRLMLINHVGDRTAPPPTINPISHCSVGQRHVFTGSAVVVTELLYDRNLDKGDSIVVEYELQCGPPYPTDTYHGFLRQRPLREFVMEVNFDAAALPARCEWYQSTPGETEPPEQVRPLDLDETNSVVVVRHDLPATHYGVRWHWD